MTDARGHELTPAEEAEWEALNAENAKATSTEPTRSEYEQDAPRVVKVGRIWTEF